MAVAPARAAAFEVLGRLDSADTTLGDALARAHARLADERDRALVTEIVTGTLRHQLALDHQIGARLARPIAALDRDVLHVLRLSAFQLLHLDRVPAAAVVNDAVNVVRRAGKTSASGLVNAVLRRLARERQRLAWPPRPARLASDADRDALITFLSVRFSHPAWLVERWLDRYGPEATERWLAFDNAAPALTVATNTARVDREALRARLAADRVVCEPTSIAPRGLRVQSGRLLASAAFRDGLCLVQDEASQLVVDVVPCQPGDTVLDACAAPGGKTIGLAGAVGPTGLVVATDIRARRVRTLRETVQRCGADRVRVLQVSADGPLPFPAGRFARILVDAPCSGLGTLRRDPDIRWRRAPEDLVRFAAAQARLLERLAPLVAPGGDLVYSTCSSEPDENEAVVERFLAGAPAYRARRPPLADHDAGIGALVGPSGYLRTLPFRDGLEAFFAAVLQRVDGDV